jgi:hypothetical protein
MHKGIVEKVLLPPSTALGLNVSSLTSLHVSSLGSRVKG